jgi:hypothetical protein
MVKRKKLAGETTNEKPIAEPKNLTVKTTNEKPITEPNRPPYETFAAANLMAVSPGRLIEDKELKSTLTQGACELYMRLKPRNAQESILSMLAVGVTNASLDCLAQASHLNVDQVELRDLNRRHGPKGATVAIELVEALNDLRGEKPEKVSVGNVNVEAGGQAIVGTVEAPGPSKGRHET